MKNYFNEYFNAFIEAKQPLKIPDTPGTLNFWHGGNLDEYNDTIAQKNGRYEYGAGLYLTTHYDTALKYAKGSRKLYLITVQEGTDINYATIPTADAIDFIKTYTITAKRKELTQRIQEYDKEGVVKAYLFNNMCINHKALKPAYTKTLRMFLVEHNIDYEIVHNPFGWGELMMVLYNMRKIVSAIRVLPTHVITQFDLKKGGD